MSDSFATVKDLASRWRAFTADETLTADVLLADPSDTIRRRVPRASDPTWCTAHSRTLTRLCCALVKRALQQAATGMPEGISQSNTVTGPFADGYTWSNPDGNLYLTNEELKDLGVAQDRVFTVGMVGYGTS